jgi:uncharacterized protein (TIGR00303 family)
MFFLFISGTEVALVPGLTAAGANHDVLPLTAPADADLIRFGHPVAVDCFPVDPDGHPTPAVITRAAVLEADIPVCVVRAGSFLPPAPPYVELGAPAGKDPQISAAVPGARDIYERSAAMARSCVRSDERIMLAESIPGGTTTALMVLRALGYDSAMSSSGGRSNPVELKEKIWRAASGRLKIGVGSFKGDPLGAISELGDPMQASVLGFINGINSITEVILAGGTQMLAIAACLKTLDPSRKIKVATTRYVAEDPSASFRELADELEIDTYVAPYDFSGSPYGGLRDYEAGCVKEGVGAGGAALYASWSGVGVERIIDRTNSVYREIIESHA